MPPSGEEPFDQAKAKSYDVPLPREPPLPVAEQVGSAPGLAMASAFWTMLRDWPIEPIARRVVAPSAPPTIRSPMCCRTDPTPAAAHLRPSGCVLSAVRT